MCYKISHLKLIVPGAWKVFALGLVLLNVLEEGRE